MSVKKNDKINSPEIKSKIVAVIDCGTNTFNLLIASIGKNNKWYPVYQNSMPVKLTPQGSSKNLAIERMARGIDVLKSYQENIVNFSVDETLAFATSAIRSAPNGDLFVQSVRDHTGIIIQVIDGEREAELIFKGVGQAVDFQEQPFLIMDIGGGSTEFIITNNEGVLWKKSYLLGSSHLHNKFRPKDPISDENVLELKKHYKECLPSLMIEVEKHKPQTLIGTSGSFDTLISIINFNYNQYSLKEKNNKIPIPLFSEINYKLNEKTLEERLKIPGLIPMRAEIIGLATILTDYILNVTGINKLLQTSFALKEGVMSEFLKGDS